MNIRRAAGMSVAEISGRARQELSKWIDRRLDVRRSHVRAPLAAERVEECLDGMPERFFPGASDPEIVRLLSDRAPGSASRIIAAAQLTVDKRFDLLGYRHLSFGDPIDWHLDPVTGRRAPLIHSSRIDPLDLATVGDSKVIWEVNRHQWLVRLGQAYRLTGDGRYAEVLAATIRHWRDENPPGLGINWSSSLEVAVRLISWCWSLALFRGAAALTSELRADLLAGIVSHARRIERYLSYYFSPNTHLTGEALGLFYAGVLFPTLPAARRWRDLGMEILSREADRQILPDGVYMEQSTYYQRYTAEIYLHFLMLAARNGLRVPEGVPRQLAALLEALMVLRRPDGLLPPIGDADGGWLLPIEPRVPGDAAGVFSLGAVVLGKDDCAWAASGATAEVLWMLGAEGAAAFDRLPPRPPARSASCTLPDGGYAVMRSGWDRSADQIIFDVGPLGCPISGGHGHADLLSIQACFRGQPYLVDPGTYRYTEEEGWRSYYRGTAAHSTVEVDGVGQAAPRGAFGWVSRPRAHLVRWISSPALDVAIAEHHAYERLPDPVVHRRTVWYAKARYCLVVDDLEGAAEHRITLRFQFAPMSVTLDTRGWVRAGSGRGLLVNAFATTTLKAAILEGETDPKQGWVSADYGTHEAAPALLYSTTGILPIRVITLLLPTDSLSERPPSVSPLTDGAWLRGLVLHDGREILRVDDSTAATVGT